MSTKFLVRAIVRLIFAALLLAGVATVAASTAEAQGDLPTASSSIKVGDCNCNNGEKGSDADANANGYIPGR